MLHRLAPSCPAVAAIVSEELPPEELALWLRHWGAVGRARRAGVLPAYVAVPPPARLFADPKVLSLLVALAQAETIEAAAQMGALPVRTFYRTLAQVRTALHLPSRRVHRHARRLLTTILGRGAAARPRGEGDAREGAAIADQSDRVPAS